MAKNWFDCFAAAKDVEANSNVNVLCSRNAHSALAQNRFCDHIWLHLGVSKLPKKIYGSDIQEMSILFSVLNRLLVDCSQATE